MRRVAAFALTVLCASAGARAETTSAFGLKGIDVGDRVSVGEIASVVEPDTIKCLRQDAGCFGVVSLGGVPAKLMVVRNAATGRVLLMEVAVAVELGGTIANAMADKHGPWDFRQPYEGRAILGWKGPQATTALYIPAPPIAKESALLLMGRADLVSTRLAGVLEEAAKPDTPRPKDLLR